MEKEICNNPSHDHNCGWCGLGKGFSWTRLVLAILLGLFIFLAGIQIGEMRVSYGEYGNGMHMENTDQRWTRDGLMMHGDDNIDMQRGTTTIIVPAQPATPTTPPAPVR